MSSPDSRQSARRSDDEPGPVGREALEDRPRQTADDDRDADEVDQPAAGVVVAPSASLSRSWA